MRVYAVIFFIFVAGVVGGAYAYFFVRTRPGAGAPALLEEQLALAPMPANSPHSMSSGQASLPSAPQAEQEASEELRSYHNVTRGFSLAFPHELSVKEHDEGDGTYTIVFEDAAGQKGFQIFFTPYMGDTITQSRILKDVPSGKFTKPVEVTIGRGTRAIVFTSETPLGEMREVWFVHRGYLYEVTTHLPFDAWLSRIMATWRFAQ